MSCPRRLGVERELSVQHSYSEPPPAGVGDVVPTVEAHAPLYGPYSGRYLQALVVGLAAPSL